MGDSVEPVPANVMPIGQLMGKRVHFCMRRHRMMKSRIEHRHHRHLGTQHVPRSTNPFQTAGVVQGSQCPERIDLAHHRIRNHDRFQKSFSAMDNPVADSLDSGKRAGIPAPAVMLVELLKQPADSLVVIGDLPGHFLGRCSFRLQFQVRWAPDVFHRAPDRGPIWSNSGSRSFRDQIEYPKLYRGTPAV